MDTDEVLLLFLQRSRLFHTEAAHMHIQNKQMRLATEIWRKVSRLSTLQGGALFFGRCAKHFSFLKCKCPCKAMLRAAKVSDMVFIQYIVIYSGDEISLICNNWWQKQLILSLTQQWLLRLGQHWLLSLAQQSSLTLASHLKICPLHIVWAPSTWNISYHIYLWSAVPRVWLCKAL